MKIVTSSLQKTWIFDLDGTLLMHNGYKNSGDVILPGVKDFIATIPDGDAILILTSRTEDVKAETEGFLKDNGVRYDYIIFGLPMGERILVNDCKPSGLQTSIAVNLQRNEGLGNLVCEVDESL